MPMHRDPCGGNDDGVGKDGTRDGVAWAEARTVDEGFGLFSLKTNWMTVR